MSKLWQYSFSVIPNHPGYKSGLLLRVLLCCFLPYVSITCLATDSTSYAFPSFIKPIVTTSANCVNGIITLKNIGTDASYVSWKLNGTELSREYTPSPISTVAGGTEGNALNQFRYPTGIVADAHGNIYVADEYNHRVQKWVPGAKAGITVAGGNGQGGADDQLNHPMGVAVDAQGNVYVADANNHRVMLWKPGAITGITIAGGNGRGKADNQLSFPHGICLDPSGAVIIADHYNHRIQRWVPGAKQASTIAGGNGAGEEADQLRYPSSVKVTSDGILYIADAANDRIQAWKPGATNGTTVAGGKGRGNGSDQLYFPTDILLDQQGNLYITDITNQRIQFWEAGATKGITIAGGNDQGKQMDQFSYPYGIAMDAAGTIYVTDQYNQRIQSFQQPGLQQHLTYSLKPVRPGSYVAAVMYKNGFQFETSPIDIHELPVLSPITGVSSICTGSISDFTEPVPGGTWFVTGNTATIDADGNLKALHAGTTTIGYQLIDQYGCATSITKTIEINAAPVVNQVFVQHKYEQQSTNDPSGEEKMTVCVGASLDVQATNSQASWLISDTNLATINNGKLMARKAGSANIQLTLVENGCTATTTAQVQILPLPEMPTINGMNKAIAGTIMLLNSHQTNGQWSSLDEKVATVDSRGFVTGMQPGITTLQYQIRNEAGCAATTSLPFVVQPQAPIVKDAVYQSQSLGNTFSIAGQVLGKSTATIQYFSSASPNALPQSDILLNRVGEQTIWVAQVENGVASPRVPFKVTVMAANNTVANNRNIRVSIMGNPVTSCFTLRIQSNNQLPMQLRVVDANGRVMEQGNQVAPNSTLQFGQDYAGGTYFVQLVQGNESATLQLLKLGGQHSVNAKASLPISYQ